MTGTTPKSGETPAPAAPPLAPRLRRAFATPRAGRAALIPYLTGGHPDVATSHRLIETLVDAGADIVELGIPYSDPIADGPVVQRSTHEALLAGVTPETVFELAAAHSAAVPFVLLTYVNSVLAYGQERFFARAAQAGVEALVIPDLPLDEAGGATADDAATLVPVEAVPTSGGLAALAAAAGVSLVPMAAPTSTDARLELVGAAATSFVYCVAVTGVTGARIEVGEELPLLLERLRAHTAAPLAVGFGISTPEQAARVAGLADGVIIGSALIDAIARGIDSSIGSGADAACAAAGALVSAASAAIAAG
ncbi:MAG: tryptophan synthase subunit alpha [Actinomycetes bacterium]